MNLLSEDVQGGDGSVLIVDDDAITRMLYSRCLKGAGFDVVSVSSGSAALSLLSERTFDLVLLDNIMPQLTGMELLELLPSRELAGQPRIVMMSATQSESMTERCGQLGVEEVLVKPVPPAVLRTLARSAVQS